MFAHVANDKPYLYPKKKIRFGDILHDLYLDWKGSGPGDKTMHSSEKLLKAMHLCFTKTTTSSHCERCLALHSTSFEVRQYHVSTDKSKMINLLAFTSHLRHINVLITCNQKFDCQISSLSTTECQYLDRIFPAHR